MNFTLTAHYYGLMQHSGDAACTRVKKDLPFHILKTGF